MTNSDMMAALIWILVITVLLGLLLYGIFGWILGDFNVTHWSVYYRDVVLVLSLTGGWGSWFLAKD